MIGKNIRYYRLMNKMSQEKLAEAIGVGKMAISNYESEKRTPSYDITCRLSEVLGVTHAQLVAQYNNKLVIQHGAFRKQHSLSKTQQEVILCEADRFLERLYEAISFVGDSVLPVVPDFRKTFVDDYEVGAQQLRQILGISLSGPVGNITDILENKGFIICPIKYDGRYFSGNSGTVNGRPYLAVNTTMPAERQRLTLIHELAHTVFIFHEDQDEEQMVNAIAGAFLLPKEDIIRELGPKRRAIYNDLRNIQREYGISMAAIVMRAYQTGIINKSVYEGTMKRMSANGLRTDEKSGIEPEMTHLLEQIISRAVAEEEIGISKAGELLEKPLIEVRRLCYGGV